MKTEKGLTRGAKLSLILGTGALVLGHPELAIPVYLAGAYSEIAESSDRQDDNRESEPQKINEITVQPRGNVIDIK